MSIKLIKFSQTRSDLLFAFGGEIMDAVHLRLSRDDEFLPDDGLVLVEASNYDFRNNLNPELQISISNSLFSAKLSQLEPEDVSFHVTIEDLRLGERWPVFSVPVSELLDDVRVVRIDLSKYDEFYFSGGFEIRCFLHRRSDVCPKIGPWSKSHVILQKSFLAKASEEDALFDINWIEFDDPEEAKNVWYFVNWDSLAVSDHPGSELFQVSANFSLRQQFKRLESNSQFGHLSIRQMAAEVLHEILFTTLAHADLEAEPASESLQEQIHILLEDQLVDFNELAAEVQAAKSLDLEQIRARVKKLAQQIFEVGGQLQQTKFGGFKGR